jgi:hypothetical protein
MGMVTGYITVFESSDGGSGDPATTKWQFSINPGTAPPQAVNTSNDRLAATMRLAIQTNSRVTVAFKDNDDTMEQARIVFNYICEKVSIEPCGPGERTTVCITKRYAPCNEEQIPREP